MPKNTMGQAIGFPLVNFQTPERPPITPMDGRYCRIEHLDIARHAAALHDANNKDRTSQLDLPALRAIHHARRLHALDGRGLLQR